MQKTLLMHWGLQKECQRSKQGTVGEQHHGYWHSQWQYIKKNCGVLKDEHEVSAKVSGARMTAWSWRQTTWGFIGGSSSWHFGWGWAMLSIHHCICSIAWGRCKRSNEWWRGVEHKSHVLLGSEVVHGQICHIEIIIPQLSHHAFSHTPAFSWLPRTLMTSCPSVAIMFEPFCNFRHKDLQQCRQKWQHLILLMKNRPFLIKNMSFLLQTSCTT